MIKENYGAPITATATGSTSATATVTGATGKTYYCTDVAVSSDKAGSILLIKDGTTTIWQVVVGAAAFTERFEIPLACTTGNDLVVTIDGSSVAKANLSGYAAG